MKPQDFVKEYSRLCDAYRLPQKSACRTDCPFINMRCAFPENVNINHPERFKKTYNIVEKWSDTHPVKTRQSEFLKMFPNAVIDEDDGILCIRPCDIDESIGCTNGKGCDDCYRKYWLAEVTDND
nr:MAG TPA: hypothetical protein [Caudoviricetes sp.]